MNLKELKDPFPEKDIEWRIQSSGMKGDKPWAIVVPYIQARAVMDRLDRVCGMDGWEVSYKKIDGGFMCRLGLRPVETVGNMSIVGTGRFMWKEDGAQETNIESIKGGISSALKRAAVAWGIGRYLYRLDAPQFAIISDKGKNKSKIDNKWYKWDAPKLPSWALPETNKTEAEDI
jgi:hypothetical protein